MVKSPSTNAEACKKGVFEAMGEFSMGQAKEGFGPMGEMYFRGVGWNSGGRDWEEESEGEEEAGSS